MQPHRSLLTAVSAVLAGALLAGCGQVATSEVAPSEIDRSDVGQPTAVRTAPAARAVVAVSIDGLAPRAIGRLGRKGTPVLHRLMDQGASTMNARTEVELTLTLPNHTGMMTSRRVDARYGGHGITFNEDQGGTVQDRAGSEVESVFDVVHEAGASTALFAAKPKFDLLARSWPESIERYTRVRRNTRLARSAAADVRRTRRAFTFVHLSRPDVVGHERGWMSPPYLRAVRRADQDLGVLVRTLRDDPWLRRHAVLLVTADHGGHGRGHYDTGDARSFRVPFIVHGRGVPAGADLYRLNPDYADPGRRQPAYARARQPIRNGSVANLATDLLGLPALADSEHDARQDLDVRRRAR